MKFFFGKNPELRNDIIKNINIFFTILFVLVIFSAYLIPLWYAFFNTQPFIFTNAWDDANYLSYQGALGARTEPGYLSLYIVSWLQKLGLAGSIQNLIFNTILPPLTTYFVYRIFLRFGVIKQQALLYAIVILFSSVLFNYSNPHIANYLGPPLPLKTVIPGWETYPSIIRIPNPQFSYFILSLCIFLFSKHENKIYLLLPIPFLYFFVLIPYLFLLGPLFFEKYIFKKPNVITTIFFAVLTYIILSILIYCLFNRVGNIGSQIKLVSASTVYMSGRNFYFPIVGCFGLLLYFLLKLSGLFKQKLLYELAFVMLVFTAFGVTNIQLITGFALAIKNFQDYGNSILGGLILVLSLELIRKSEVNLISYSLVFLQYLVLFFIAKYTLLSQNFSFESYSFYVTSRTYLSDYQVEKIKSDPLHAIIVGADFAQALPYGYAKMLISVFGYQYNYPFVLKQCSYNELLAKNALMFVNKHYSATNPVRKEINERAKLFFDAVEAYKKMPYLDKKYEYCQLKNYESRDFYVVIPNIINKKQRFPNW